jgi:hypothetical protein
MAPQSGMTERIFIRASKRQKATLKRLREMTGFESDSELFRDMARARCEELGIEWPEDNQPADGSERMNAARKRRES